MAAMTIRPVICEMKPAITPLGPTEKAMRPIDLSLPAIDKQKILLQPRVCTLRSYGSADRTAVIRTRKDREESVLEVEKSSPFFTTLSDYIESSKRSQDFETISGRLAMVVFAATVAEEFVTGNSLFRKMDLQGIEEAGGVCVAAVACAATFAWFSSARNRVGQVFLIGCNNFFDSLIDQIIDGLFYDDRSDDDM
ncbi:stress enhanced protein 2, chloroplastic [Impatiens glandulifera]|uniref:stress enhanced protein 2, chloroplastic n=1 Tax=Impatiens glandulifera TaxID=253017 RepID=UPI001FB19FF0|nr:stress enhanced protein 2, chloroplastic [Impatiens glandulifera]